MQREKVTPVGLIPLDQVDLSGVPEGTMPSKALFIDFPKNPQDGDEHVCLEPFGGATWMTWRFNAETGRWACIKDE